MKKAQKIVATNKVEQVGNYKIVETREARTITRIIRRTA